MAATGAPDCGPNPTGTQKCDFYAPDSNGDRQLAGFDATSETRWGAAVGAGIEYAFVPNWSIGFQYDHLFMGNRDVNSATGFLITDHIKEDVDLFTARLNYKFGGPVVARY